MRDDERVLADLVQRGERADAQGPAINRAVAGDAAQLVEAADVDDPLGCGDAQPHPVQELGAAREDGGVVVGERGDGGGPGVGAGVGEVDHRLASAAARTAAVICGYDEQRQMLPLIHSRTVAASVAWPSAMQAVADTSWPGVQ